LVAVARAILTSSLLIEAVSVLSVQFADALDAWWGLRWQLETNLDILSLLLFRRPRHLPRSIATHSRGSRALEQSADHPFVTGNFGVQPGDHFRGYIGEHGFQQAFGL
jgi:hypothetical protein